MGQVVSVQADSLAEVEVLLAQVCAALGFVPVGRPLSPVGRGGRWLARAAPPGGQPGASPAYR